MSNHITDSPPDGRRRKGKSLAAATCHNFRGKSKKAFKRVKNRSERHAANLMPAIAPLYGRYRGWAD